jgi:hypothetical protein
VLFPAGYSDAELVVKRLGRFGSRHEGSIARFG